MMRARRRAAGRLRAAACALATLIVVPATGCGRLRFESHSRPAADGGGPGLDAPLDPCRGVDCSGHGACAAVAGAARCACDAGYRLEGDTRCVAIPAACTDDARCADESPCSSDQCVEGACVWTPTLAPCDDGDPCTKSDACDEAFACAGRPYTCDDGDPATLDRCLGDGACEHVVAAPRCLTPLDAAPALVVAEGQSLWTDGRRVLLGLAGPVKGVQIFEATTAGALRARGLFRTDMGPARLADDCDVLGIDVAGDTAYLADYYAGLAIVDVADLDAPRFLGAVAIPSESWMVQVRGTTALVANWRGLVSVDARDPTAPALAATLPLAGQPQDVHLDGARAYVTSGSSVSVVDVAATPALAGELATGFRLYEVWAPAGGPAYVVDKPARQVLTIDVSVTPPRRLDATAPDSVLDFRSIAGSGGTLVVGLGSTAVGTPGAVRTYDITGTLPVLTSEVATSASVFEVAVVGDVVFAATNDGGVATFALGDCP